MTDKDPTKPVSQVDDPSIDTSIDDIDDPIGDPTLPPKRPPDKPNMTARAAEAIARADAVLGKMGRPVDYTTVLGERVCELMATRNPETGRVRTLQDVCTVMDLREGVILGWLRDEPRFAQGYDRARETRADMMAEEISEIADTDPDPRRAKVRVDARKWTASHLNPARWGERTILAGQDGLRDPLSSVLEALNGRTRGLPTKGDE